MSARAGHGDTYAGRWSSESVYSFLIKETMQLTTFSYCLSTQSGKIFETSGEGSSMSIRYRNTQVMGDPHKFEYQQLQLQYWLWRYWLWRILIEPTDY